ncbi:MAG TPA: phosphocholine cytidylyltransferase family protein [Candidatus Binatia bacterium]
MKAIVLNAGYGRRLRPATDNLPKCLLPIDADHPLLETQLRTLARCGIRHVTIMVGYGAEKIEHFLTTHPIMPLTVQTRYNPFFATTNTAVTCWLAIRDMTEDFILVNGDTLFDTEILRQLLAAPEAPLVMAIDQKASYDADDMKVTLTDGGRLKAVGKSVPASKIDGESIGLMAFRAEGVAAFRSALEIAVRDPDTLRLWYHDIINVMASTLLVNTVLIKGLWWREIDTPRDLAEIRASFVRQELTGGLRQSPRVNPIRVKA